MGMPRKVLIAVGGEPATGKSRLMREVLRRLRPVSTVVCGLAKGHRVASGDIVLGTYGEAGKFDGTDRLSMAVQPSVVMLLDRLAKNPENVCVLFEGDRLFNLKLLEAAKSLGWAVIVLVLRADHETLAARHKQRADTQPEQFLRSRRTKIANITGAWPGCIDLDSRNEDDFQRNVSRVLIAVEEAHRG